MIARIEYTVERNGRTVRKAKEFNFEVAYEAEAEGSP